MRPWPSRLVLALGLPIFWMLLASSGLPVTSLYVQALFVALLLLLAAADLLVRRIPDLVVLPATVLAVILPHPHSVVEAVAAGLAAALAFYALFVLGERLFGPGALGMGDVKLAMLVGAMLGFAWAPEALLLGILLAGIAAAALLLTGRARRGDTLPYGAALAAGAILVLVYAVVR
jgi:leader peptidase (prepilin peptidase)/N-methyltransferase